MGHAQDLGWKMETNKWMEWAKSNRNRPTAKSLKFTLHPNPARTKALLSKVRPSLEVEKKKRGNRCDYGFMIEWLLCWESRALGQGFAFGFKNSPSFNFESDLIHGLEATQHAQLKVEIEGINFLSSQTMRIQALFQSLLFYCVRETQKCTILLTSERFLHGRCWRLGKSYAATKESVCWFAMDFWWLCQEAHTPWIWKDMDISCGRMHNVRVLGKWVKILWVRI